MASNGTASDVVLNHPPKDQISAVTFSPQANHLLLVSSWDQTVQLYDVHANDVRASFTGSEPLLDSCFSDGAHGFSGGLDNKITSYDFNSLSSSVIGEHDDAVRCLAWNAESHVLATGSWDSTVKIWDPRTPNTATSTSKQPQKVYTMDSVQRRVVVGTAGRHVLIYDLRDMTQPWQKRESSLKYQTRAIRCFPNGQGYVLCSTEGRVAVEYFDPSPEMQSKKYAFKCHREKIDNVEWVYPVNAAAFHSKHGTFATGGGDGGVTIWDAANRKRLRHYARYPSCICSLSFSNDGLSLAIGSSYNYQNGDRTDDPPPPPAIFIKPLTEMDTLPRTASTSKTGGDQ